ncbi:MAG: outer membrane protein assembly factor BamA [Alphaproteobacteria bacterium]|jgi:outer membrane protein insertion porin family|nr:outer membrane protein assembly factor BamA [Alphaproteobacteria bacterium]MBU1560978.1 outer membrane protein assembly factor BamA [Alphaproteobacteria bacterium]MBU2304952.1 outer membrane protein assembly factor BamA [Alphaproteobacteria bacterium]MBU2370203.1 outer membrane protein assembly factor BamA [Alphaproteobacteria bacterium]
MIHPTKLMRGAFLALAILGAAPLAGPSIPLLGVVTAQAQEQLVGSVLFEGNRRFSDSQLLAMVDVSASGIYSQQRVASDIESIRQAYDRDGFLSVSVTSRTEATADGRVRVVFVVNEGTRAGIAAINFTGNNAFAGNSLKSTMLTKETGILSWLFKDDSYDEQKLAVDRERIRLYYANRGYPDAQVTSVGEYDAARNAYFINFTINEGQKYEFANVGIETSISGLNTDALRGTVQTADGRSYSVSDLQETIEEMAYEATVQGYSFVDVRARLDRDVANGTFNVTYLVDEGARLYVERINITGNTKTRDFVIRRELEFAEGDAFNRALVVRGRKNIDALGFFSSVNVTTGPGSSADRVVINIAVTEASTGEYGATAGYSTQDGILGEVSLTERNFLGRGQYLRAAIGASQAGRTFDFSFTEPRFMGLKVATGIDVYHRIDDENTATVYGSQSTGGQLRAGVPLTSDLSATLFVGGERKVIKDNNPDNSLLVNDGQEFYKAFVGYTLTWNGVDDVKKPTEGLYATFTQQYVGWDHSLIRSEARARYYVPLLDDSGIVGSVRGQAGIINDLSGNGVHAVEAFSPGSQLIRGFEGRGLGPRLANGEYLGAVAYAGASAEIQFPIPGLPENYGVSGAIWADAAWVDGVNVPRLGGNTVDPNSIDVPWRTSIGASLIWDSPFGPLRGDFAHVLNKSTADRTQVFQLTMSTLF